MLARQLNSPLLLLLVAAALVSIAVGEHADAGIILAIIGLSVGLGFANEVRSERAVEALHERIRHTALTVRDGRPVSIYVTELVPGDLVRLGVGDVVPADLRLLAAGGLECDEAVLTGESLAEPKTSNPALAIAVGHTPQLLPAIVTISLSTGARRLARAQVVVKRLVAIEDLGNIQMLCTDKTGTLTEGRIRFEEALDAAGAPSSEVLRLGLLYNRGGSRGRSGRGRQPAGPGPVGGRPRCWRNNRSGDGKDPLGGARRLAVAPFDYERRLASALVAELDGRRRVLTKGAPEVVLSVAPRCRPPQGHSWIACSPRASG